MMKSQDVMLRVIFQQKLSLFYEMIRMLLSNIEIIQKQKIKQLCRQCQNPVNVRILLPNFQIRKKILRKKKTKNNYLPRWTKTDPKYNFVCQGDETKHYFEKMEEILKGLTSLDIFKHFFTKDLYEFIRFESKKMVKISQIRA